MKTTILFALLFAVLTTFAQDAKITKDISPGMDRTYINRGVEVNGLFVFPARVFTEMHFGLWVTDGTDNGTTPLVEGLIPSFHARLTTINDLCYFYTKDGDAPNALWRSDGTTAGTSVFYDFGAGNFWNFSAPIPVGDRFAVGTFPENAPAGTLWISDTAHTTLFEVPVPGVKSTHESKLLEFQDNLFVITQDDDASNSSTIWEIDLSDLSFEPIYTFTNLTEPYILRFCGASNEHIYLHLEHQEDGKQYWTTDGTAAGTQFIKEYTPPEDSFFLTTSIYSFPQSNRVLFSVKDSLHGIELWVSDGTEAGTQILKDINPEGSSMYSYEHDLHYLNGHYYFLGYDPINKSQLWRTDGTPDNTEMVTNEPNSYPYPIFTSANRPVVVNDLLFFLLPMTASDGMIMRTDGTPAGTFSLIDEYNTVGSIARFVSLSDSLMIFAHHAPGFGYELWKTDGNESAIIKDIAQGSSNGISNCADLWIATGKDRILFRANDGVKGIEPWILDFELPVHTVNRPKQTEITVFPNPARQEVFIPLSDQATIDIFNSAGVLVLTKEALINQPLDISGLPPGVYVLKARQSGETARFIKQ